LKAKIKEDAEAQFATQADQKLLDVTEFLIESTKSIYLQNFLKMVTNCRREKLSPEEAETEYVRSGSVFN
jgi:trigger factor